MASTAAHPFVTLRNGVRMPAIGLGTYQVKGEVCKSSVRHALSAGYRHIDTAAVYKNEGDVGVAIRESGISREEIFITSKLQPSDHGVGAYEAGLATLKRLNIEYLDCFLIHWPGVGGMSLVDPAMKVVRKDTWLAMQRLYAEGKCKAIGVSNYMRHHLDELCTAEWCTVVPFVNQFEIHPMLQQRDAVDACAKYGIQVEAYSSLARGAPELMTAPAVVAAATAHDVKPAQVLLRWALQKGYIVIPKSTHPERIEENARIVDWSLSSGEMDALDALDGNLRTCWDPTTVLA